VPRALVKPGEQGARRGFSISILGGEIDLSALERLDDTDARARLMAVGGIGPWTADIYLLSALRRPDVWPSGDLALAVAVQEIKRLPERPTPKELDRIALPWRPWHAVAARMLWHHYLSTRNRRGDGAAYPAAAPI
jgi:DNA-3-methyladenine glycosylase II